MSAAGDAVLLLASGTLDVSGGSADIVAVDLGVRANAVTGSLPGDVDNLAADITGTGDFAFSDSQRSDGNDGFYQRHDGNRHHDTLTAR